MTVPPVQMALRSVGGCLVLIDPAVEGRLPVGELLGLEPEGDLLLGRLDGVGAVGDVTGGTERGARSKLK